MTTITLDHVTKYFEREDMGRVQRVAVVDNVSFKLTTGAVLAILGPSGCGKSTLLRMVAGLVTPDVGKVLYEDVDLQAVPVEVRGIGMVFQDGALIPHWDAGRNIGFFLRLRKREDEVPARVARISQITGIGLEQLLDRRPSQLSGGERQRVGIARALARDPRVFLFDEPFSNLDAKLRTQARLELKRLLREFPVTSIYVTHDQIEAVALADRTAVMREGRLEQMGDYATLYHYPRNLFVATFIGTPTMNLFRGRVLNHHWHGDVFMPLPIRGDIADGTEVIMGIRAEHLQFAPEGQACFVEAATPHYAERHQLLDVAVNGQQWLMQAGLDVHVVSGDKIYCRLDPAQVSFFDAASEQRIG
jgi:multiple sugar transport system ATP-binding protein